MITEVPAATPVTIPVDEPTVATVVLLLLHVPDVIVPTTVSMSVDVLPTHAPSVPCIIADEEELVKRKTHSEKKNT